MSFILTIVGARPQFVKAAVVSHALHSRGINEQIIHTGQHYDYEMSTVFWEELGIPAPASNLEVGSGTHGTQTGFMLTKLEQYILDLKKKPAALLVYGDTNSTLAGALVASKLHIPIVHIEAGLRSFNREMPEEINRVVTDHISSFLFCSSQPSVEQLAKEGITENVFNVGDVMYDALLRFSEIAESKISLNSIIPFLEEQYYLATVHRPVNTDSDTNLDAILEAFAGLDKPVVWPVHPRNKKKLTDKKIPVNLHLIEPASYHQMMILLKNSYKVITDSGGLQKEAYWMKKQCITIREQTEWTETLEGEWNILTGADASHIIYASQQTPSTKWTPLYGDGKASQKIAEQLQQAFTF